VHTRFLAGFVTAGLLLSPVVFAADKAEKKSKANDDMAQAIAFERHKDAAAARQARIEAKHPTITYSDSDAERSADRDNSKADKTGNDRSKQERRQ
jgi:hypothetical protein